MKTKTLSRIAGVTGLLLLSTFIVRPVNLVAAETGGPYLTFSPDEAAFGTVVIGETANLDIQITNTSAKSIQITSITITVDPAEFSETNNCPEEIAEGASCTLTASFRPLSGGGYHGAKKAIFEFYQGTTEIAYLHANGQAL